MEYRTLGRTGLSVSAVGFGAWAVGGSAYGNSYGPTDDAVSRAAIAAALELGCTFFDTADVYGHGHSETLLGEVLAAAGVRERVVIATKVGANFYNRAVDPAVRPRLEAYLGRPLDTLAPDAVLPVTHGTSFDPAYVRFACEQSLRRLRCDTIDLYQLHNPSLAELRSGALWQVLDALKAEGKIRFYGVSIHEPQEGIVALASDKPDALQVVYNLFDRAAESTLFALARAARVGVIAREPLANGLLTGKYAPGASFPAGDIRSSWPPGYLDARIRRAARLQAEFAGPLRSLAQVALRFVLDNDAVTTTIPGAKTAAQVVHNLAAAALPPLTDEERRQVRRLES